jgi:HemY protein
MRPLFWLLALSALAVGASLVLQYNQGYVLFFYPPYRLELNLSLFAVALFVCFAALLGLARLFTMLVAFPTRVRAYREGGRATRASAALERATLAWMGNNLPEARTALLEAKSAGAVGAVVDRLDQLLLELPKISVEEAHK